MTNGASWGSTTMAISFKGAHFPQDIILMGVRWYLAYPLSYRHVEELLEERGVPVDHATIQRWVVKYSPQLEDAFHRRKRPVWVSWRMDETYIRVKGQWYYLLCLNIDDLIGYETAEGLPKYLEIVPIKGREVRNYV